MRKKFYAIGFGLAALFLVGCPDIGTVEADGVVSDPATVQTATLTFYDFGEPYDVELHVDSETGFYEENFNVETGDYAYNITITRTDGTTEVLETGVIERRDDEEGYLIKDPKAPTPTPAVTITPPAPDPTPEPAPDPTPAPATDPNVSIATPPTPDSSPPASEPAIQLGTGPDSSHLVPMGGDPEPEPEPEPSSCNVGEYEGDECDSSCSGESTCVVNPSTGCSYCETPEPSSCNVGEYKDDECDSSCSGESTCVVNPSTGCNYCEIPVPDPDPVPAPITLTVSPVSLSTTHTIGVSPCSDWSLGNLHISGPDGGSWSTSGVPTWVTLSPSSGQYGSTSTAFNCNITDFTTHTESGSVTFVGLDDQGNSAGSAIVPIVISVVDPNE